MQRLYRLTALALVLALTPWSPPAVAVDTTVYVLNGSPLDDGTAAVLDFDDDTLMVSGDLFSLSPCATSWLVCIKSDYMTVVVPRTTQASSHWTAEGFDFHYVRDSKLRVGGASTEVREIRSPQGSGEFAFFVSRTGVLVAWRHTYKTMTGDLETYEYKM
ncbi:hypothetical protein [Noviluteimonas gilva]|uniref:Uncharacterized protein n=1 Tax=Noviluteimonas gilva TaxID=2682097 RepID=A0A7C9LNP7_9GAMM|nr:hypothetical protein [Lysobacter gilvus]MUV14563.1 hypothetical protein [Lysobacter gilvus]